MKTCLIHAYMHSWLNDDNGVNLVLEGNKLGVRLDGLTNRHAFQAGFHPIVIAIINNK